MVPRVSEVTRASPRRRLRDSGKLRSEENNMYHEA